MISPFQEPMMEVKMLPHLPMTLPHLLMMPLHLLMVKVLQVEI